MTSFRVIPRISQIYVAWEIDGELHRSHGKRNTPAVMATILIARSAAQVDCAQCQPVGNENRVEASFRLSHGRSDVGKHCRQ